MKAQRIVCKSGILLLICWMAWTPSIAQAPNQYEGIAALNRFWEQYERYELELWDRTNLDGDPESWLSLFSEDAVVYDEYSVTNGIETSLRQKFYVEPAEIPLIIRENYLLRGLSLVKAVQLMEINAESSKARVAKTFFGVTADSSRYTDTLVIEFDLVWVDPGGWRISGSELVESHFQLRKKFGSEVPKESSSSRRSIECGFSGGLNRLSPSISSNWSQSSSRFQNFAGNEQLSPSPHLGLWFGFLTHKSNWREFKVGGEFYFNWFRTEMASDSIRLWQSFSSPQGWEVNRKIEAINWNEFASHFQSGLRWKIVWTPSTTSLEPEIGLGIATGFQFGHWLRVSGNLSFSEQYPWNAPHQFTESSQPHSSSVGENRDISSNNEYMEGGIPFRYLKWSSQLEVFGSCSLTDWGKYQLRGMVIFRTDLTPRMNPAENSLPIKTGFLDQSSPTGLHSILGHLNNQNLSVGILIRRKRYSQSQ